MEAAPATLALLRAALNREAALLGKRCLGWGCWEAAQARDTALAREVLAREALAREPQGDVGGSQ